MDGPVLMRTGVRPWRPADTQALADLWVRAWQETMPSIDFAARRAWIVGFLDGPDAAARATLVACGVAGSPQGFVTIEPALSYLHQLAVAPEAKGGGIAGALLEAAKAALPDGLSLDVNQANARAVRFYERRGFLRESAGVNAGSGLATWTMRWHGR